MTDKYGFGNLLGGIPIYCNNSCPKFKEVPPKHRFFEWEPKDEPFLKKYGMMVQEPCYTLVGATPYSQAGLFIHPDNLEWFKKGIDKHNEAKSPASR